MKRIIIDIAVFICVLCGWWFVALPLGLIGAWGFTYFIELVLAGLAYDALFAAAPIGGHAGWMGFAGSIVSVIGLCVDLALKKFVRK